MGLSAADFMKGVPEEDHVSAEAFMKGQDPSSGPGLLGTIGQSFNESVDRQGGWGLTPESQEEFGFFGHKYGPADVAARGLTGLNAAFEGAAGGLDYLAEQTGLADLPGKIGLDVLMNNKGGRFLPGQGLTALAEALPAGGTEAGIVPHVPRRFAVDTEAAIEQLYRTGTADEILQATQEAGGQVDPGAVVDFVKKRDAGARIDPTLRYDESGQSVLPMEEQGNLPFERPTQAEAQLQQEADAFLQGRPSGPELDYRQRNLPLDEPAQQLGLDLPEPAPKPAVEEPPQIGKNVQSLVDHVNKTTQEWKNAPAIEVHSSFDDLPDVDSNTLGVYDADSGQIRLNTKAIEEEAAVRGLSPQEMTNTVVFHEGLGHFGLNQAFRSGLDNVLESFYNDDESFRGIVKDWMKENPDAYSDHPNRVVRASEEVLAEMSEGGQLPLTLVNKAKNYIKATARKMGLKLDYSRREIETILAQAHDKVINGTGVDPEGAGLRYKNIDDKDAQSFLEYSNASSTRPSQLFRELEEGANPDAARYIDFRNDQLGVKKPKPSPFTELRQTADGTKYLEYTSKSGETIPIKMAIDNGVAEIAIDQFSEKSNRLGPAEIRKAMLDLAEQYPEIESFGGYRRSGAGAGRVQEISLRQEKITNSVNRYMRSSKKKSLSSESLKTSGDEDLGNDLINFLKDKQDETRQVVSDPEIDRRVKEMGLTASSYVKGKTLADQNVAAKLDAARNILVNSKQRLVNLGSKANKTGMTPSLYAQMTEELAKAKAVYAHLDEDSAELGRSMRILRRAKSSKESVASALKFMKDNENAEGFLTDPKDMMALIDKLQRSSNELTPEAQTGLIKEAISPNWSERLWSVLNIPRTLKSSLDFSAPFRQGLPLLHTKEFWKAWGGMFKAFGSESAYNKILRDITSDPNYPLMQRAGVYLAGRGGRILGGEEAFLSNLATKLPGVKHSERAYVAFLDKLRADTFNRLLAAHEEGKGSPLVSKDIEGNPVMTEGAKQELKDIGTFINSATGRGPLGKFEESAPWLSAAFWSPRLFASRLHILAKPMMPSTYTKLSPVVRKEYLKSFLAVGGMATVVTTLAKNLGADVEDDPLSPDFNKIKIGNTRYDILGGEGQLLTLAARLASGKTKTAKGEVKKLGAKFGDRDLDDVLIKFVRSKAAPIPGYIWNKRAGKNLVGESAYRKTRLPLLDKDVDTETLELFVPMILSDLADLKKDKGTSLLSPDTAGAIPAIFGIGMQTYDANKPRAKEPEDDSEEALTAKDFMSGQEVK